VRSDRCGGAQGEVEVAEEAKRKRRKENALGTALELRLGETEVLFQWLRHGLQAGGVCRERSDSTGSLSLILAVLAQEPGQ
jgi:hypothetical protein